MIIRSFFPLYCDVIEDNRCSVWNTSSQHSGMTMAISQLFLHFVIWLDAINFIQFLKQSLIPSCDFTNTLCVYNYTLSSIGMDCFA